jgi:hypothetical protein
MITSLFLVSPPPHPIQIDKKDREGFIGYLSVDMLRHTHLLQQLMADQICSISTVMLRYNEKSRGNYRIA